MKSTLISKENNDAKFTMEFSAEEFEDAVIKVYKSQKDKFIVDGFRKGKAPKSIIEKNTEKVSSLRMLSIICFH